MQAMTDDELLELAAKAAGIEYRDSESGDLFSRDNQGYYRLWNPLKNDGDALRLAIKLHITIDFYTEEVFAYPCGELYRDDPFEATRRAIVRAAASKE
jgi:hypothetical protein